MPDTPNFSPEAIAALAEIAKRAPGNNGWAESYAEDIPALLAALEASERENERLLAALRRIAGLGMNPRHPGASYEIAAAALTPSTPPDLREDA